MNPTNFYCQKKCGDINFSIREWNHALKLCKSAGFTEEETNKILFPETDEPCKHQCESCANIVLDTRSKNKNKRYDKLDEPTISNSNSCSDN